MRRKRSFGNSGARRLDLMVEGVRRLPLTPENSYVAFYSNSSTKSPAEPHFKREVSIFHSEGVIFRVAQRRSCDYLTWMISACTFCCCIDLIPRAIYPFGKSILCLNVHFFLSEDALVLSHVPMLICFFDHRNKQVLKTSTGQERQLYHFHSEQLVPFDLLP